ncbi:MAG TPA: acetoacetate--CoA ligase [Egibacteraceae bacterium]|nr:acetoacetate--CoA ligase [Egibacteraceae bacterium]
MSEILWVPPASWAERSHLRALMAAAKGAAASYEDLWKWSVEDLGGFWARVWDDCGVIAAHPYREVLADDRMPGARWFPEAQLNFAENLLRRTDDRIALIGAGEGRDDAAVTYGELRALVGSAQRGLTSMGLQQGDRVAAIVPNCVEAVVLMLACAGMGAIWSSCSPDFGVQGMLDRFAQVRPRLVVAVDGYRYGGALRRLDAKLAAVVEGLPSVDGVVLIDFAGMAPPRLSRPGVAYDELIREPAEPLFRPLEFSHPLYLMFSSGTTGPPKTIVHSAGGTLLQHRKEHRYHVDLHSDGFGDDPEPDVIFWFTTCGWMMWNWLVSALASEVTVVLYDGSPGHPDLGALWRLAERAGVTHFGTSPKFLASSQRAGVRPRDEADLSRLRAVLSTGSPLNPEQFDWLYDAVKADMQVASISGGTDIIGCFAGGAPMLPVRRGELQCRMLGMAVEAWDDEAKAVIGEKGELVCTRPFPSMPTGFWGDDDGSRYRAAYFERHPGVWTHGDYIEIRPEGGVVIYGRSDTTLNPGGVRIGTAEIYRAVETMPEIADSIAVGLPHGGDVEVVLCVQLADDVELDADLSRKVKDTIREANSPRHVPAHIYKVSEIPYTRSGKKVEKAVQSMMTASPVDNREALANPQSLDEYASLHVPHD